MGRSESIRKLCACGREIKTRDAEMCRECQLRGPAQVWNGKAIWHTAGKSEDLANANVCPKRAAAVDEIDARIRARKAGAR